MPTDSKELIYNKTKNITNPLATAYVNQYYEAMTPELDRLREDAEANSIPVILRETETYLKTLLWTYKPKVMVEIGAAVGYSAIFFVELIKEYTAPEEWNKIKVYTIEKSHEMFEKASENIKEFGYADYITVLEGDGEDGINELLSKGIKDVDFVFIDAAKSQYKRFFEASIAISHVGSVIVCDNVLFHAKTVSDEYDKLGKHRTNIRRLREFVEFIMTDKRVVTSVTTMGDGTSISYIREK